MCRIKNRKHIYRSYVKVSSFTVISDVYRSFIRNETFTKYCLTQWISKPRSFEIHWVRHYHVNFHGSGGHNKQNRLQNRVNFHRSQAWQIVRIYNTACIYYMCGCIAKGRLIFSEQGACAEKHWPKCLQLTPTHIYLYSSGHDEEYIPMSFALFCCDISVLSGFMSSNCQTFFGSITCTGATVWLPLGHCCIHEGHGKIVVICP